MNDRELRDALTWFYGAWESQLSPNDQDIASMLTALGELAHADGTLPKPFSGVEFWEWGPAIGHPAAVAWRAASPFTPEPERAVLVAFLRTLASTGLTGPGWRTCEVIYDYQLGKDSGRVIPTADGFIVTWFAAWWDGGAKCTGLQFSRTPGSFALPENWRLHEADYAGSAFGAAEIERFCQALEQNGPLSGQPGWVDAVSAATGLSTAEATLLLAGLPSLHASAKDFLGAPLRKQLGLTAPVAAGAKLRFESLSRRRVLALVAGLMPADAALLWSSGPDLAQVNEAVVRQFGRRQSVPDDILAAAAKELPVYQPGELISGLTNPTECRWLTTDAREAFGSKGWPELTVEGGFESAHVIVARKALPWLAYHLPAGSPVRAQLVPALRLVRERLAHPDLYCNIGLAHGRRKRTLLSLLRVSADQDRVDVDGWLTLDRNGVGNYTVYLRPGGLRRDDWETLRSVVELLDYRDSPYAESVFDLLGEQIESACAATGPADAYFQNPVVSVPDLLVDAMGKFGLDEDAAALYLQLLALPDPTDANVMRWNGWSKSQLGNARDALAKTDLVISAKRAKAGRSLFLPGGWQTLKKPHAALEEWKLPLFGIQGRAPATVVCPLGTVEELFRVAWQRVVDGDVPAYEDAAT